MADQRSPLKEFRHLDEKLRTVGLSAQERARWEQLRDLVSAAAPLRPGFDVKAAAAELKASLEPAGLRRPAAPPAPAPEPSAEPETVAISELDLEPEEPAAAWPIQAQAEDAAVPSWEGQPGAAGGQTWDAAPPAAEATAWDAGAQPLDASAQPFDPNAQPWDAAQPADAAAQGWEAAQPEAAAWDPGAQPLDAGTQPLDPNAQPWDAAQPADTAVQGWEAAQPEAAAWDPGAQPLNAGEPPFDPNAQASDAAQPPEGATPEWEAAPEAQPGVAADLVAQSAEPGIPTSHEASAFAASTLDFSGGELTPEGAEALDTSALAPPGDQQADAAAWAERQPEPAAEPGPWAPGEGAASEGLPLASSQDPGEAVPPATVEDAPPLELASAADFLDAAAAAQAAPPAEAGEGVTDLGEIAVEEIPTVDAEEILEELAPELAGDASPSYVAGEHRVVVHTIEGQVIRGTLSEVDLDSAEVPLREGGGVQLVPSSRIKAIFFMLLPGGKPPPPEGHKVRVTFRDGRQVAGFSADYDESRPGFFMVPADTRTNTGRIWVYRSATRQVSVT